MEEGSRSSVDPETRATYTGGKVLLMRLETCMRLLRADKVAALRYEPCPYRSICYICS